MNATVNDNAIGVWAGRVGHFLTVLGPGANSHHVLVKRPEDPDRKAFGFPVAWLDWPESPRIAPRPLRRTGGILDA